MRFTLKLHHRKDSGEQNDVIVCNVIPWPFVRYLQGTGWGSWWWDNFSCRFGWRTFEGGREAGKRKNSSNDNYSRFVLMIWCLNMFCTGIHTCMYIIDTSFKLLIFRIVEYKLLIDCFIEFSCVPLLQNLLAILSLSGHLFFYLLNHLVFLFSDAWRLLI